jgi:hypothetical protein
MPDLRASSRCSGRVGSPEGPDDELRSPSSSGTGGAGPDPGLYDVMPRSRRSDLSPTFTYSVRRAARRPGPGNDRGAGRKRPSRNETGTGPPPAFRPRSGPAAVVQLDATRRPLGARCRGVVQLDSTGSSCGPATPGIRSVHAGPPSEPPRCPLPIASFFDGLDLLAPAWSHASAAGSRIRKGDPSPKPARSRGDSAGPGGACAACCTEIAERRGIKAHSVIRPARPAEIFAAPDPGSGFPPPGL